jgi:TRAP-type C4-dicarboxylate transport system permease large subunit
MKISQDEIQDLYAFTRQHFVEHYDLQTELVDHLANDIESIWIKQPKLHYREARDKAFKKFGVFGFMDVLEKRHKAMNKKYIKYLWFEFKKWFTFPKLLITLTVFIAFYTAFSTNMASYVLVLSYGLIAIWCIYKSIQLNRQFRRRKEKSQKKWMLEEIIFKQAGGSALMLISQLPTWFRISGDYFDSYGFIILISIFSTFFVLWMYVSFELLPNKAEDLLNETYPEFSL